MLNRFKNNYQVGEFASPDSREAYFFCPQAIEKGILDIGQLNPNSPQEAALKVRNNQIPAQAGSIELPSNELAAYDLVSGIFEGNKLTIGPSFKDGVEKDSRDIRREGLLTLTYVESGLIKVIAEVATPQKSEWAGRYRQIGNQAVRFFGVDAPVFELDQITEDFAIAKRRASVFSIPSLLK